MLIKIILNNIVFIANIEDEKERERRERRERREKAEQQGVCAIYIITIL